MRADRCSSLSAARSRAATFMITYHGSGIRIHTYGPHYFRTSDDELWAFANRFSAFYPYEASLKSWVEGRYENWPIAASYIRRTVGPGWKPEFRGEPRN